MIAGPLGEKVLQAKQRLLVHCGGLERGVYIGHSGGKDSCVVTDLALTYLSPFTPIVHNLKEKGVHPLTQQFLYRTAEEWGIDFVRVRDMEKYLKTKGYVLQIDGTRRAEFDRTDRSNLVMVEGKEVNRADMPEFIPDGRFGLKMLYPIVDWTDDEVWEYIHRTKLAVSEEYADQLERARKMFDIAL